MHDVGDAVAYGVHLDLAPLAQTYLDQLRQQLEAVPGTTVNELSLQGTLDDWTVDEVTQKTLVYYGIKEDDATGVEVHFRENITQDLMVEGTHPGTRDPNSGVCGYPLVPTASRTVTARVDLTYLETASGIEKWNVSDFALLESTTNHSVDLLATVSVTNFPDVELNATRCEIVVSYRDVSYRITADLSNQYRVAFRPAFDAFDFPMSDGENWPVNSTATLAGTLRGTIDVQGLDPDDERMFFEELNRTLNSQPGFTVTGLDGFPIVLERITVTLGVAPYLKDGVLRDIPVPVNASLHAEEMTMTLADGFHTVYELRPVGTGPQYPACYYSPDHGFIVGCAFVDASTGTPLVLFELRNVPPADARQNIETTKTQYAVSVPGNPLLDFFLQPPYLGLILVAAAVIAIAALLGRRRRKPAMMAPSVTGAPPPQAPTPPPEEPRPEEL